MTVPRIGPDALAEALAAEPRPFLLDVRPPGDFEAGRVPGARHCPVHELSRRPRDLPPSKVGRVLVFADTESRGRAAVRFLQILGYVDVALVEGGVAAHRGALETGPPPPPPRAGPELRIVP